jgi:hypothetical protein
MTVTPYHARTIWRYSPCAAPTAAVSSEWRRSGRSVRLDVSVPFGTRATIRLPGRPDVRVGPGEHRLTTVLPS